MDPIAVTTASILAITGLGWAARRWLRAQVCPICLGVGGTWAWMLAARQLGYGVDAGLLSMLLGASVAGVAFQLEKRLPTGRSPLLWKTLFIPAGLLAACALVAQRWALFGIAAVGLALLAAAFLVPRGAGRAPSGSVDELTRKLRDCC